MKIKKQQSKHSLKALKTTGNGRHADRLRRKSHGKWAQSQHGRRCGGSRGGRNTEDSGTHAREIREKRAVPLTLVPDERLDAGADLAPRLVVVAVVQLFQNKHGKQMVKRHRGQSSPRSVVQTVVQTAEVQRK